MRIQCTFNLAPELHEQHSFVVENLRAWQVSEKERNDDKDIAQQRRSMFHRDIYMSGLYLHKLSAELPKLVSEQFKADSIDIARLVKQIKLFDIDAKESIQVNNAEQDVAPGTELTLADSQWQKMEQLLNSHQQQVLASQQEIASTVIDTQAVKQTTAVDAAANLELKMLAATEQLTKQLSSMQDQQAQLLARIEVLHSQASEVVKSENEHTDYPQADIEPIVEPIIEKSKLELLQVIETNQQWLVNSFNTLKRQVTQLNGNAIALETLDDVDIEKAALSSQLQRASKIKSKGLW